MSEEQLLEPVVLLPNEIKALETEVENEVRKEERRKKRDELKAKMRREIQQRRGLEEGTEEIFIDLAKHSDRIIIDGVSYLHGVTYTLKASLARDLRWIMQSTHWHQAEIDGKPKSYYTTQRNAVISPRGIVNRSELLRA